jgi:hypothetical protein
MTELVCLLCDRAIEGVGSKHHLIPVLKGGKHGPTIVLHDICHQTIHAHYKESHIAKHLFTTEMLKADSVLAKFVEWVRTKPNDFYTPTKMANKRKK